MGQTLILLEQLLGFPEQSFEFPAQISGFQAENSGSAEIVRERPDLSEIPRETALSVGKVETAIDKTINKSSSLINYLLY